MLVFLLFYLFLKKIGKNVNLFQIFILLSLFVRINYKFLKNLMFYQIKKLQGGSK